MKLYRPGVITLSLSLFVYLSRPLWLDKDGLKTKTISFIVPCSCLVVFFWQTHTHCCRCDLYSTRDRSRIELGTVQCVQYPGVVVAGRCWTISVHPAREGNYDSFFWWIITTLDEYGVLLHVLFRAPWANNSPWFMWNLSGRVGLGCKTSALCCLRVHQTGTASLAYEMISLAMEGKFREWGILPKVCGRRTHAVSPLCCTFFLYLGKYCTNLLYMSLHI